jgi:hypothetical protein
MLGMNTRSSCFFQNIPTLLNADKYSDQISHVESGLASAQGLFQLVEDDKRPLANFVHGAMEIDFRTQILMAGQARLRFGGADQAFELQSVKPQSP